MILEDLKKIDRRCRRAEPASFEIPAFEISTPDRPATEQQLEDVQRAVGVRLPPGYRSFLSEFGGGVFGFVIIFSADPDSAWHLPGQHMKARRYLPKGLLAFSDDLAGGHYVFKIVDGKAEDDVFYWNMGHGGLSPTPFRNMMEFKDMMEFVTHHAYEPA